MSKAWTGAIRDVSLLCQMAHQDDRPSLESKVRSIEGVRLFQNGQSSWTTFQMEFEGEDIICALFVRKLILSIRKTPKGSITLENTLSYSLQKKEILNRAARSIISSLGGDADQSHTYLVVNCDRLRKLGLEAQGTEHAPGWVSDGMTTFALRAFDSRKSQAGIIRVSRHLTITYGLTDSLISDINNLIFEKILYGNWPTGSDDVFSLLDALGSYVLPTEVSLYTHKMASKLAAFAVVIGILFSIVGFLQGEIIAAVGWKEAIFEVSMLYAAFSATAAVSWYAIGKIISKFAE